MNCSYHLSHCEKCGRRCRNYKQIKSKGQKYLFPIEFSSYPFITQTNDNHNRKSHNNDILIDQLIPIQQNNSQNSQRLKRVQQMIYLRENINNLNYREVHFPSEYIILKRLEEKNNLSDQNRFKVDHYYRPLKIQYQTINTVSENSMFPPFSYSKQASSQTSSTSSKRSIQSRLTTEKNDTTIHETTTDSIDSLVFIRSDQQQQAYSQNANDSCKNLDHLTRAKKFDTAVIVDVRKCSELTTHQSVSPNQYPLFMNIQQSQLRFFPYSQNTNSTHQIDPIHQSYPNNSYETTWFPSNIHKSNESQYHYLSSNENTTDISSSLYQLSENPTSSMDSNISPRKYIQTIDKIKQILTTLRKYLSNKITVKNQTSNNSSQSSQIENSMTPDSLISTYSISSTTQILDENIMSESTINLRNKISQMEFDSLNQISYIKLHNSAKNLNTNQQTTEDEHDPINISLNSSQSNLETSTSRHIRIEYMSSSFMFVLQILLILCVINRILMHHFYGILPSDTLLYNIMDSPPTDTLVSSKEQTSEIIHKEEVPYFLSPFFA